MLAQKIVITGCNGLLGQTIVNLMSLRPNVAIYGFGKGENRNETTGQFKYVEIDLVDFLGLEKEMRTIKPDVIVNCAAITNVDLCETEHALCDLLNITFVERLIEYCTAYDAHLVHISTDFIFDGKDGPYKEDDAPNPINYYGLSKLTSEQIVTNAGISSTILRTILVYGKVDQMAKPNIVLWIKEAVEQQKTLTIVDDQFRMPTYVVDLANACIEAAEKKIQGIFHISSSEMMSIYEMAIEICTAFDLDNSYIKRIPTSKLIQAAKRPPITGFDLQKSKKMFSIDFESFKTRLLAFKKALD